MSTEYYLKYDTAEPANFHRSSGPPGAHLIDTLPAGWVAVPVPLEVYNGNLGDLEPALLELFKDKVREIVKKKREAIIESGVDVPGIGVFDSTEEARANVDAAALAALAAITLDQPFEVTWTLKDNTSVTLNAQQMLQVQTVGVAFISAIHDYARNLRTATFDDASTAGELMQINFNAGWSA